MVTISADGSTVTTSSDFSNLMTQYGNATPPSSPSQSAAGTTSYPSCPQQNSTWLASTTIPATPNVAACQCLENNLSCQFTPSTKNYTAIVGALLNYGCSIIGVAGGSCNAIAANGSSGQYGLVSECDPSEFSMRKRCIAQALIRSDILIAVALSYVMTEYYIATAKNPQSCSFNGNGTINTKAPSTAGSADAVASSCLASASSTSVPTIPAGAPSSAGTSSSSGKGSSSAAPAVLADARTLLGMGVIVAVGIASGLWTIA